MLMNARAATMRTSDAERQRVADFLRDACADGRLGPDELEHRLDRLFAGGTVADVEALVWGLPGGGGVVPPLHPAAGVRPPARHAGGSPAGAGAVALIGLGVVAIALA